MVKTIRRYRVQYTLQKYNHNPDIIFSEYDDEELAHAEAQALVNVPSIERAVVIEVEYRLVPENERSISWKHFIKKESKND